MNRIYNNDTFILEDLTITQKDEHFCLNTKYHVDSKYHSGTLTIKDMILPIHSPIISFPHYDVCLQPQAAVDIGLGELQVNPKNINYKVTEYKPQSLTLEEIEEKLGYKINLVSRKESK